MSALCTSTSLFQPPYFLNVMTSSYHIKAEGCKGHKIGIDGVIEDRIKDG